MFFFFALDISKIAIKIRTLNKEKIILRRMNLFKLYTI